MRIAELSSRSGTSIPSIKYYLREGLLPAGTSTGRNQADYGAEHLYRLRLIRALIDVGGLSVAAARDVLGAVDTPDLPGHTLLGTAHVRRRTPEPARPGRPGLAGRPRPIVAGSAPARLVRARPVGRPGPRRRRHGRRDSWGRRTCSA